MIRKKLEILEIYNGEVIDMNDVHSYKSKKSKLAYLCSIIKNCFVSAFPKAEWLYIRCLDNMTSSPPHNGALST